MTKLDNSHITKVLGQVVTYPDQYDPGILVREPRSNNRQHIDIQDDNLPFVGFDTWNAYEVSTLTNKGLPVAGCLKIVYPCTSKYIVESKSIKLYLNSFNMYKCGETKNEAIKNLIAAVTTDLNNLLETKTKVSFVDNNIQNPIFSQEKYKTLEDSNNIEDINFNVYNETPELLKISESDRPLCVNRYHSGLLKSNCRVTSQPDWGDIYISYMSHNSLDEDSLLEYIVSFRDECHFHEEICETVFTRLNEILDPISLCVTCLYARRGGIDINPTRALNAEDLPEDLINSNVMHYKTQKQ